MENAFSNEIRRLAQGICDIIGTKTIKFVHRHEVPRNKPVVYAGIAVEIYELKEKIAIVAIFMYFAPDKYSVKSSE